MTEQPAELVETLYRLFNARDIDGIFELLHADARWANGMDGGYAIGLEAVETYWTRQWKLVSTKVTPLDFQSKPQGLVVKVHQEVSSIDGELLSDSVVSHLFSISNGKISRFDILES